MTVPFDYANTTGAVTIADPFTGTVTDVAQLSQRRADSCAVLLEDGKVLVAGGAYKDADGALHTSRLVDLINPDGAATEVRQLQGPTAGTSWHLQEARHRAACVRLRDGSVLITGGLRFTSSGGQPVTLDSAEVYVPGR